MNKSKVSCNYSALNDESNIQFVNGTFLGSRKQVANKLCTLFNFPGGYRAAYTAVKNGYIACDTYAGKMSNDMYGINCKFAG